MADNSPPAYLRDGVVYIRMSALGMCPLALWGYLRGVTPTDRPEYVYEAAEAGRKLEDLIAARTEASQDVQIVDREMEVIYWVIPSKLALVGHIDGRIYGTDILYEAKGMSVTVYAEWLQGRLEAAAPYAWQASGYALAAHCTSTLFSAIERQTNEIDEKAFKAAGGWRMDWWESPPAFGEKDIKARALTVYAAYLSGERPACEQRDRKQLWHCPMKALHDEVFEGEASDKVVLEMPQLEELVGRWVRAKAEAAAARSLEGELGDEVKAKVGPVPEDGAVVACGAFEVTVSKMKGRVDTKAMERDGVDVESYRGERSERWSAK